MLTLRFMLEKYNTPPWEWDENYPDDMYGRYYPEDIDALVQIDMIILNRIKEERENQNVSKSNRNR